MPSSPFILFLFPCFAKLSVKVGESAAHKPYNRYRDILAHDHTRVVLSTPSLNTDPKSDYINANMIPFPFITPPEQQLILSQGPLENTTPAFWQMVLQYRTSTIVMVTECIEGGRAKCFQYWPTQKKKKFKFGPIIVECVDCVPKGDIDITTLSVLHEGTKEVRGV